ncbi:hypothetical protein BCV69DRAFT_43682 [Microstroma glucosiphilum]|uniref:Uncharacterized protein n=1 Tax=Pseudomicrostroma glucosiphilum TaxID=1684307 RepID=A0A316U324_9BASI|nr:hypothetical protein BCV69DRAFT_43682 [Pseudomicrostroma glucosiphilum]PWN19580.1 hypothetical protein BCV69DRAFT_43682 [Pseudomicrostroma glucosiphilum]
MICTSPRRVRQRQSLSAHLFSVTQAQMRQVAQDHSLLVQSLFLLGNPPPSPRLAAKQYSCLAHRLPFPMLQTRLHHCQRYGTGRYVGLKQGDRGQTAQNDAAAPAVGTHRVQSRRRAHARGSRTTYRRTVQVVRDNAFAGNSFGRDGAIHGPTAREGQTVGASNTRGSLPSCPLSEGDMPIFLSFPFRQVPGSVGHVFRIRAGWEAYQRIQNQLP